MPRRYNLNSFPAEYLTLAETIRRKGLPDFHIQLATQKAAQRWRFRWYTFLTAMEQAGNQNFANELRQWVLTVDTSAGLTTGEGARVNFASRSNTYEAQAIQNALQSLPRPALPEQYTVVEGGFITVADEHPTAAEDAIERFMRGGSLPEPQVLNGSNGGADNLSNNGADNEK